MISRGSEQDGSGRTPAPVLSGHVDDWAELAVDYLDGRAAPETKAAIQRHLQECPVCAARLDTQQSVVAFLQETYLDDPPLDLEDRVIGEVLFPSQPVATPRKEEPQGWSVTWNKRIRPWLPATVAVVALLAAVIGYGVVRSGGEVATESAEVTPQATAAEVSSDGGEEAVGAPRETTLADAPTTTAGAATTLASVPPTETTVTIPAAGAPERPMTLDRNAMITELEAAEAPAYLAFMSAAPEQPGDSGSGDTTTTASTATQDTGGVAETAEVTPEQADEVADQITSLTGLEPLPASLSLGRPTFAAYVSRDRATQLIDLVRSIGTSVGLVVGLIMSPPLGKGEVNSLLLEHKRGFCELIAQGTAKPAVSNWSFTTSTSLSSELQQDDWSPPDEAGTHVLVVIYVQDR